MRGRWKRRSYPLPAPRSTQRNPLAEFERELIRERTRAEMRAARRRGRHVGRPRRLTPDQLDHARALIAVGRGKGTVAALLGVHVAALRRALRVEP